MARDRPSVPAALRLQRWNGERGEVSSIAGPAGTPAFLRLDLMREAAADMRNAAFEEALALLHDAARSFPDAASARALGRLEQQMRRAMTQAPGETFQGRAEEVLRKKAGLEVAPASLARGEAPEPG